jgi:hypothetical protein
MEGAYYKMEEAYYKTEGAYYKTEEAYYKMEEAYCKFLYAQNNTECRSMGIGSTVQKFRGEGDCIGEV